MSRLIATKQRARAAVKKALPWAKTVECQHEPLERGGLEWAVRAYSQTRSTTTGKRLRPHSGLVGAAGYGSTLTEAVELCLSSWRFYALAAK
jgi:hypothetical protein